MTVLTQRAMEEFDQSEFGQFNQLVEEEMGESIPLEDMRDIASPQVEIEETLLPRVEGETKRQRAKRVLRNLLKRPNCSVLQLDSRWRFKSARVCL